MDVRQVGVGECSATDPDKLRAFMRTEKRRELVDNVMPEAEPVRRYVKDGDYVSFDFSSFTRGPASLVREIIRSRQTQLRFAAKFTFSQSGVELFDGAPQAIQDHTTGQGRPPEIPDLPKRLTFRGTVKQPGSVVC